MCHKADHLERSADSVVLNMSEGIGCFRPRMKISAYEIARKEANEVRAVLRRLAAKRVLAGDDVSRAIDLAGACVGMQTSAIIAAERRLERDV